VSDRKQAEVTCERCGKKYNPYLVTHKPSVANSGCAWFAAGNSWRQPVTKRRVFGAETP
jgi:hypothetical protein